MGKDMCRSIGVSNTVPGFFLKKEGRLTYFGKDKVNGGEFVVEIKMLEH